MPSWTSTAPWRMSLDTGERLRKYWYLYLEIPKKNGKSELAAALGLYHLFADGELNAEGLCVRCR